MSAEGKKKRGAAGVTNALNSPWRLNGRPPDWQARAAGANRTQRAPSSGSVLMRGLIGGIMAQRMGGGRMFGDYESALDHAQQRVTHPYLIID